MTAVGRATVVPATATVVFGAVALGAGTTVLHARLPVDATALFASGVAWWLGTLVLGAAMPGQRSAALAGAAALPLAAVASDVTVRWFGSSGPPFRATGAITVLVGFAVGVVAGAAAGALGRLVRAGRPWRWLALSPVAGVLIGEAIRLVRLPAPSDLRATAAGLAAVGIVLATLCGERDRRSGRALASTAGATIATVVWAVLLERHG